jgi:3-oxoacyl-[acyl-carrier protein] reductase
MRVAVTETTDGALSGMDALVTGAAGELGLATARTLARSGARVCLADIDASALSAGMERLTAEGFEVWSCPVDVLEPESLGRLMGTVAERTGAGLDVLVANVGVMFDHDLQTVELAEWSRCIELNLTSVMLTFQAGLPLMQRSDAPSMIAMASGAAFNRETNAGLAYAAAKAGVVQLVRVLATRLGPLGVRVNAVSPGIIDSPMTSGLLEGSVAAVEGRIPLRRLGSPEEVAAAVLFLASPASRYVSGEVLHVSGGS